MFGGANFATRDVVKDTRPSIIVATVPKSGTKYVGSTIARTLGYQRGKSLYFGSFPKNVILRPMAADFARGGMVLAGHLQADRHNFRHLVERGLTRFVLHVRDPRACVWSWLHHAQARPGPWKGTTIGGERLLSLGNDRQIDFHIAHFFVDCVEWLTGWADALERPDIRVAITSHDELVRDEQAMFTRIFGFYGIDAGALVTAPKDAQRNYRSGDADEWRHAIAPAQIARMTSMIPERLFHTFGWRE